MSRTSLILALEPSIEPEVSEGSSDRSFGLVFAGIFALLGLSPLRHHRSVHGWALGVSAALVALSLIHPSALRTANLWWTKLSLFLNKVASPLVMGAVFFVVATPTGVLMRWLRKDLLRLRFDPGAATYWQKRSPPGPAPDSMTNQF